MLQAMNFQLPPAIPPLPWEEPTQVKMPWDQDEKDEDDDEEEEGGL